MKVTLKPYSLEIDNVALVTAAHVCWMNYSHYKTAGDTLYFYLGVILNLRSRDVHPVSIFATNAPAAAVISLNRGRL